MDFLEIRTRCAARFRDIDGVIVSDDGWKGYVNDAYADVQAATPFWPWQEAAVTLVAPKDERDVQLPLDVVSIKGVLNADEGIRMDPIDGTSEHLAEYPTGEDSGPPQRYMLFGQATLRVYPKPSADTNITVEYVAGVAELGADDSVPEFPAPFHRILVVGALAEAYEDDANADMAQVYDANFTALLEGLKIAMLTARQEESPGIVDNFFR